VSFADKFTVTPLLYACAALTIALVATGGYAKVQHAERDTARSERAAAVTERDAWKSRANDLDAANSAWGITVTTLQNALAEAQGDLRTLREQDRRAIAQAQADAANADRTLQQFTAKYQAETRKPDCAKALQTLEAACPALSGY
jgi:chromosome segregation ATPase